MTHKEKTQILPEHIQLKQKLESGVKDLKICLDGLLTDKQHQIDKLLSFTESYEIAEARKSKIICLNELIEKAIEAITNLEKLIADNRLLIRKNKLPLINKNKE